jgi:hypothetical protein
MWMNLLLLSWTTCASAEAANICGVALAAHNTLSLLLLLVLF